MKFNNSMEFFQKLIHDLMPLLCLFNASSMCKTYCVLSCKLATSYSIFSIFILSGKNGKPLWRLCKITLNINFKTKSFTTFFIIVLFSKCLLNWKLSIIYSRFFTWSFCNIYIPELNIWRLSVFIIIFHVFFISFCIC